VFYGEGLTTHTSPESFAGNGNIIGEGLTRERKSMSVRPTQLTIMHPAFQKFRLDYDLFQNL